MRTIFFALLFFCSFELLAQSPVFNGGSNDGYSKIHIPFVASNNSIFNGGGNDGHSKMLIPFVAFNNGIFNGGSNDGYSKMLIPFAISNNSIFSGGGNDGYSQMLISFLISNNSIFSGGVNDGYTQSVIAPLPGIPPTISIVASQTGQLCSTSQQLIFTAATTSGGLNPIFQWKLNNNNVGSNGPTYENNNLQDNDVISCVLTSSAGNAVPSTVTSNVIVMSIITATQWYADGDADGYGNAAQSQLSCTQPIGFVGNSTDCDDTNAAIHQTFTFYIDADGDGVGADISAPTCAVNQNTPPAGYSTLNSDCDDTNPNIVVPYYRDLYRSKLSGSWSFAYVWEKWDGCHWIPALHPPDFTDDTITIRSSHDVSITNNITVDQVVVEAGATLSNSSSGVILTVVDGPGDDIIVNGLFILSYQGISNGAGNIVINGRMLWSTGRAIANLVINPGGILDKTHHNPLESTDDGIYLTDNSSITNYGIFNWRASNIGMCGGYIMNMPGGVINATEDYTMTSFGIVGSPCSGAFLDNKGTFNKLEGTGNTDIYFGIANSGIINVNSGELRLMGGSTQNSGTINIAAGSYFTVGNGANMQLNTGTVVTGAGIFKNAGYGQPSVTVNTSAISPAVINNYLQSSNMFGSGTVQITGGMEWQGGAIAAHVVLAPGSVSSKTTTNGGYLQDSITNRGIFNWENGDVNFNNGTFNNAGVFNINSDNTISNGNTNIFNNSGTLNKNAGTGSSLFYVPINNSSVINVNDGELRLAGGTSINTGNINIAAGKLFTIDNGANLQLNQGTVIAGAGTLKNSGYGQPSVTVNASASNPASISNYLMGSNTYGSGTVVITGGMEWQGGTITANIILPSTAVSSKTTSNGGALQNGTITNSGIFNWIDGILEANSAIYTNTSTGIINVSSGGYFYSRNNSIDRFNNAGIFRRINSNYPTDIYVPTNNSGAISGIGELQFLNGLNNTGAIAPGITAPGKLKINNAQPLSTNSVLNIKMFDGSGPGTGHDQLLRAGNLTLAGTLNVTETGSVPSGTYTIISLTSGTISGSFSSINLPAPYTLQVLANSVVITKSRYYADSDGDGYGDVNNSIVATTATPPAGYVTNSTDCNDGNAAINPGAIEICNGIDDNCDGKVDTAMVPGIKLYLPFNGNANGFGHSGTVHNATLTSGHTGVPNTAYQFNGAGQYIEVADHADLKPANFTVSTWIYYSSVPGGIQAILGKPLCGGWADSYGIWFQSGALHAGWANGPTSMQYYSFAAPAAGQWHHVVLTFDDAADQAKVYIDNALAGTFPTSFTIAYDNTPLVLGVDYENCNLSFFFNGKIDEVTLIERALSTGEISSLYLGSPLVSVINTFYADSDGDGFGNPSASVMQCIQPAGYVLNNTDCNDNNAAVHPGAVEVCDGIDNNCDGMIDLNFPTNGLVAYYPFNGNANDAVGTLNGTVNGATLTTDRFGNANSAYTFDGVNDFISTSNVASTQTDNWTLSAWVKPAAISSDVIVVQNGGDGGGVPCNGYSLGLNNLAVTGYHPCVTFLNSGSVVSQANQWMHLTMVRQSGVTKFYLNAVQAPNTFTTSPINPAGVITIGSASGIRFFNGSIDDIKIYNVALTPAQVLQDYNSVPCSPVFTLNLKLFLQGYYTGAGAMQPVLNNQAVPLSLTSQTDLVTVELHHPATFALVDAKNAVLSTNGNVSTTFVQPVAEYYVAIRHRNTIETWTASPVLCTAVTPLYDFSTGANKAYGNNQVEVEPNVWAFFTGDLNQDDFIDGNDFPAYDSDSFNGVAQVYVATDMNGDGFVDGNDFPVFDSNSFNGVSSVHP